MTKFNILNISVFVWLLFLYSCATISARTEPPLEVVNSVDINRYLGKWYEIARYPNWFQEDCYHVTAYYELNVDGSIKVINRCKDRQFNGKIREAVGIAHIVDHSKNTKLKVSFHWPFYGNYWIVGLGDDYEYAVVSEPKRQYLWILSRKPTMDTDKYNDVVEFLKERNFDVSFLMFTSHE